MFALKLGNSLSLLSSVVKSALFSPAVVSSAKLIPEFIIISKKMHPAFLQQAASFKVTAFNSDLMEFFDKKEKWGLQEVKVGREWRKDELRIKSNSDLHKLWFVLLKERNMLLTMEYECKQEAEIFPNPERIDKVNISMENLEAVVRERNRAYFELETGHNGERPGKVTINPFGLRVYQREREYFIPHFMNNKWKKDFYIGLHRGTAVRKFLKLYREKLSIAKRKQLCRERNHVMHLFKRFPDVDEEAIKKHYPSVDISRIRLYKKTLGHHDKNLA